MPSAEFDATHWIFFDAIDFGPRSLAPAKKRILETASRLFYDEGIRAVGIDRLIRESHVTKATFYKHFGAKDRLILDYITLMRRHTQLIVNSRIASIEDPEAALECLLEGIISVIQWPGFRGCPFLNAALEYADPTHPVRVVISEHYDWYSLTVSGLFAKIGHPLPGDASDDFTLARDGAMAGASAGDPTATVSALRRGVSRIVAEAHR